jgi:hypothetical protein
MPSNTWLENSVNQFIALTLAFATLYAINNAATPFLHLVPGAHLVHIPSGIKFLMVLVFSFMGALSIATVSLVAGLFFYFPNDYAVSLELALVNAASPLLALKLVTGTFRLGGFLEQLHLKKLIKMGLVFAVANSALNQLVIYWNGLTTDFLSGLGVMLVGDITGFAISLMLLKLSARFVER